MSEKEETCGKCWKLDFTTDTCERYDEKLIVVRPGVFKVYAKCDECKEMSKPAPKD